MRELVRDKKMIFLGTVDASTAKALKGLGWDMEQSQIDRLMQAMQTGNGYRSRDLD